LASGNDRSRRTRLIFSDRRLENERKSSRKREPYATCEHWGTVHLLNGGTVSRVAWFVRNFRTFGRHENQPVLKRIPKHWAIYVSRNSGDGLSRFFPKTFGSRLDDGNRPRSRIVRYPVERVEQKTHTKTVRRIRRRGAAFRARAQRRRGRFKFIFRPVWWSVRLLARQRWRQRALSVPPLSLSLSHGRQKSIVRIDLWWPERRPTAVVFNARRAVRTWTVYSVYFIYARTSYTRVHP